MSATCFLVLGVPRSGTSVTAGILHHLGVFMGERFLPTTKMNPRGFWHDLDFELSWTLGNTQELITKRQALGRPWGVNTRRSTWVSVIAEAGPTKIIVTNRSMPSIQASCEKWFKTASFLGRVNGELQSTTAHLKLPTLQVDFDELLDATESSVQAIADFVGVPVTRQAVEFVEPSLRTF